MARGGIRDITLTEEGVAAAIGKLEGLSAESRRKVGVFAAVSPVNGWSLLENACDLIYTECQLDNLGHLRDRVSGGHEDYATAARNLREYCVRMALQEVGSHGSNQMAGLDSETSAHAMKDLAEALRMALGE